MTAIPPVSSFTADTALALDPNRLLSPSALASPLKSETMSAPIDSIADSFQDVCYEASRSKFTEGLRIASMEARARRWKIRSRKDVAHELSHGSAARCLLVVQSSEAPVIVGSQ